MICAGDLDKRIRIERPIPDNAIDGAGSGAWELVATVRAQIRDELPSKGERIQSGINLASRPARVRMRWRGDVTAAIGDGGEHGNQRGLQRLILENLGQALHEGSSARCGRAGIMPSPRAGRISAQKCRVQAVRKLDFFLLGCGDFARVAHIGAMSGNGRCVGGLWRVSVSV